MALPPDGSVQGVTDIQSHFRPCHANEEKPAFFFQFIFILRRVASLVGQQPFFDADNEHILELESLGRVQRHQSDTVAGGVVRIGIAEERDLVEVVNQRRLFRLLVVVGGAIDQFVDVLHGALAIGSGGAERFFQSRSCRSVTT